MKKITVLFFETINGEMNFDSLDNSFVRHTGTLRTFNEHLEIMAKSNIEFSKREGLVATLKELREMLQDDVTIKEELEELIEEIEEKLDK